MSLQSSLGALILSFGLIGSPVAIAQQEMTPEELEIYIEKQKAALERVRKNRELTEEKAREAREALAAQEKRRAEIEAQVEALCTEREEVEPGTYDECVGGFKD